MYKFKFMDVKKITFISVFILSIFFVPYNIFILKNIYKKDLIENKSIDKHPYIEVYIFKPYERKYKYYSEKYINIKEVFLEVVLRNFSDIYHIEKQNESFRHYFKELKNPGAIEFLKNINIKIIKDDYINTLNKYADKHFVKDEIKFYSNKIDVLKEELKNENSNDLKKEIKENIFLVLNKIHQLKNISQYNFKAFQNELKISITFPKKKNEDFLFLNSMYLEFLSKLDKKQLFQIYINIAISLIILNVIYILFSILIIKNIVLISNLNLFIFKKKNNNKIRK